MLGDVLYQLLILFPSDKRILCPQVLNIGLLWKSGKLLRLSVTGDTALDPNVKNHSRKGAKEAKAQRKTGSLPLQTFGDFVYQTLDLAVALEQHLDLGEGMNNGGVMLAAKGSTDIRITMLCQQLAQVHRD